MRTLNRLGDESLLKIMIDLRDLLLIKNCEYRRQPMLTFRESNAIGPCKPHVKIGTKLPVAASGAPIATRVVEGQAATRAQQPGAAGVRKSPSPRRVGNQHPPTEETRAKWAAFDLYEQFR